MLLCVCVWVWVCVCVGGCCSYLLSVGVIWLFGCEVMNPFCPIKRTCSLSNTYPSPPPPSSLSLTLHLLSHRLGQQHPVVRSHDPIRPPTRTRPSPLSPFGQLTRTIQYGRDERSSGGGRGGFEEIREREEDRSGTCVSDIFVSCGAEWRDYMLCCIVLAREEGRSALT